MADWLETLKTADRSGRAWAEFVRSMRWITFAGVVMVAISLWYLSLYGALHIHMVIATIAGVFLSVLLGAGLFAAAFFSDKSGHDRNVTDSTRHNALAASPASLPDGLESYRRTADFTEKTVPAALRADHTTKEGSWGLIVVEQGALAYRITDPRRPESETLLTPDTAPGVIEPTILHHVEPQGAVRFHVEFWRAADKG
jgi:tellurite resistance-related uncharacterized protein